MIKIKKLIFMMKIIIIMIAKMIGIKINSIMIKNIPIKKIFIINSMKNGIKSKFIMVLIKKM